MLGCKGRWQCSDRLAVVQGAQMESLWLECYSCVLVESLVGTFECAWDLVSIDLHLNVSKDPKMRARVHVAKVDA